MPAVIFVPSPSDLHKYVPPNACPSVYPDLICISSNISLVILHPLPSVRFLTQLVRLVSWPSICHTGGPLLLVPVPSAGCCGAAVCALRSLWISGLSALLLTLWCSPCCAQARRGGRAGEADPHATHLRPVRAASPLSPSLSDFRAPSTVLELVAPVGYIQPRLDNRVGEHCHSVIHAVSIWVWGKSRSWFSF